MSYCMQHEKTRKPKPLIIKTYTIWNIIYITFIYGYLLTTLDIGTAGKKITNL